MKQLALLIGLAICLSSCFSYLNIQGATESRSRYERLDVIEAAITREGVLIINGSHFLDGFSKEKDYTILMNLDSFVADDKIVPKTGLHLTGFDATDFVKLSRSTISSGKTTVSEEMTRVRVINKNCKDIIDSEIGRSTRKVNYKESKFALCSNQSWGYEENYNGWLLASDAELSNSEYSVGFGFKEKKRYPSLGWLLLTPFTLIIDVFTSPIQIIYFEEWVRAGMPR